MKEESIFDIYFGGKADKIGYWIIYWKTEKEKFTEDVEGFDQNNWFDCDTIDKKRMFEKKKYVQWEPMLFWKISTWSLGFTTVFFINLFNYTFILSLAPSESIINSNMQCYFLVVFWTMESSLRYDVLSSIFFFEIWSWTLSFFIFYSHVPTLTSCLCCDTNFKRSLILL